MGPPAAGSDVGTRLDDEEEPADAVAGRATLGTVLWLLTLAWSAGIAGAPLTDNSFLTHLATGRLILDRGSVPSTDPYTFTAAGTDWTVQSWLASVVYAAAERAGGALGLRIVVLILFGAAAALLWRLTRPCTSLVPRIAIVFGSLYIVTGLWGERPFMVGVIGLGLVWLALDRQLPPWALVPIYWVWANSHGSFPLGLGLTLLYFIGLRLDRSPTGHTTRVTGWSIVGVAVAVIGPLGPRVLLFPLTALSRADLLSEIVEWKPATFQSLDQRLFLLLVAATVLSLMRRPSWTLALPTVVFVVAAIVAQRNLVMAVMVLVPVLAATVGPIGDLRIDSRPELIRAHMGVGVLALIGAFSYALMAPFGSLDSYPARPVSWLETTASDDRYAAQDFVGNLLAALDGEDAAVFVDDRVDMLPEDVVLDGLVLLRGQPRWEAVLDDRDLDLVVWERSKPLGALLASDPDWRVILSDTEWIAACRRGPVCDRLGRTG